MRVRDIMVKREEIKFLSTTMSLTDALIEAHIHRHTRFPLVEAGHIDDVLGYVNFKDIVSALRLNPSNPTLPGIVRPVISVNPDDSIATVIGRLIKGYNHIAVVKEPSGTVVGLVSLEDVIETVVGDIKDEFDMIPGYVNKYTEDQSCAGGAAIMRAITGTTGGSEQELSMTVNDFVSSKLKRPPRVNDVISAGNFSVTVTKVRRSRVFEALFEKKVDNKSATVQK
jgi:putative hemolysin